MVAPSIAPPPVVSPVKAAAVAAAPEAKVAANAASAPVAKVPPNVQTDGLSKAEPVATVAKAKATPSPARAVEPKAAVPHTNRTPLLAGALVAALVVGGGAYWFTHRQASVAPAPVAVPATAEKPATPTLSAAPAAPAPVATPAPAASAPTPVPEAVKPPAPAAQPAAPVAAPAASAPAAKAQPAKPDPAKALADKKAAQDKKAAAEKPQPVVRPAPAPSAPEPVHTPAPEPVPVKPAPTARSLDELFNERVAAECPSGFSGILCREKVRFSVCADKWSEAPPPGQSTCKSSAQKH